MNTSDYLKYFGIAVVGTAVYGMYVSRPVNLSASISTSNPSSAGY